MNGVSPSWALDEVDKRAPRPLNTSHVAWEWKFYVDDLRRLAASLIAKHEEKPVDPLLKEAREIVAKFYDEQGDSRAAKTCRGGYCDTTGTLQMIVEGLRRGIEIAEGSKHD